MNTNLKIALLLGYVFNNHGWTSPEEPSADPFKFLDNIDYEIFNYDKDIINTIEKLENKYYIRFNFVRIDGIYKMQEIAGMNVPDIKKCMDKSLSMMLKKAIEMTFKGEIDERVEMIKDQYSFIYHQINDIKREYI